MTDPSQRELELGCIDDKNFIEEQGSVRSYYKDVGEIIGASEGKETRFVYVEHLRYGDVHGCPITEDELRKLGVKL